MIQSLDDKIKFNQKRGTQFSIGYIMGVKQYRNYSQKDRKGKRTAKKAIDEFSKQARNGDEFAKGIMCGIRDAANERKQKNNNTFH